MRKAMIGGALLASLLVLFGNVAVAKEPKNYTPIQLANANDPECSKECWRRSTLKACMQCAATYGYSDDASRPWCRTWMRLCKQR